MHNALAFTTSGVPLGILSQCIWARGEIPEEDYQEKIERLQCTAIVEKESSKWLIALRETVERAPPGVKVITVADRESDFFEFITLAQEQRARFLIRARTDRMLVGVSSSKTGRRMSGASSGSQPGTTGKRAGDCDDTRQQVWDSSSRSQCHDRSLFNPEQERKLRSITLLPIDLVLTCLAICVPAETSENGQKRPFPKHPLGREKPASQVDRDSGAIFLVRIPARAENSPGSANQEEPLSARLRSAVQKTISERAARCVSSLERPGGHPVASRHRQTGSVLG